MIDPSAAEFSRRRQLETYGATAAQTTSAPAPPAEFCGRRHRLFVFIWACVVLPLYAITIKHFVWPQKHHVRVCDILLTNHSLAIGWPIVFLIVQLWTPVQRYCCSFNKCHYVSWRRHCDHSNNSRHYSQSSASD